MLNLYDLFTPPCPPPPQSNSINNNFCEICPQRHLPLESQSHRTHTETLLWGKTLACHHVLCFTPINPQDPSIDHFATFVSLISGIAWVETVTWFCNKPSLHKSNQEQTCIAYCTRQDWTTALRIDVVVWTLTRTLYVCRVLIGEMHFTQNVILNCVTHLLKGT